MGGGLSRLVGLLLLFLAGVALPARGQTVVEGRVEYAGRGVAGAVISAVTPAGGGAEGRSAADGSFSIRTEPGDLRISVRASGFEGAETVVRVAEGDTVRLLLTLLERVVRLAELQVTATPIARDPLRVPQSTTSLGADALQRERGSTIGATLAGQPGIAVRWDGPAASAPVIRGLSGERIVILQDGQRTGDLAATAPDHAVTIDPAAANRIEIVRGPAALLYGSNAIGGVVNVLTGDLPQSLPSRVSGAVEATLESGAPGGALSAEAAMPVGSSGVVRVRAGHRHHGSVGLGGGLPAAERDGWGGASRLPNTQSLASSGALSGTWRYSDLILATTARIYDFEYGLPHPAGDPPVVLSGYRHELLSRASVSGGRLSGARAEVGVQWYQHDESDADGVALTSLAARSASVQLVSPLNVTHSAAGALGISLYWRDNDVIGDVALTPPNGASNGGVFFYQEFASAARLSFPVGIRLDRNTVNSRNAVGFGEGRRRDFTALSGSAGVSILMGDGLSLGASVARAVRAPTAEELFARAGHAGTGAFEVGDPELDAERAHGAELVLRARGQQRRAQASIYVNRISGYIALYPTGRDTVVSDGSGGERAYPLHMVTQRDATLAGAEASAELELGGGVIGGVLGDIVRGRDGDGEPLPHVPAARLGASLRLERGSWSLGTRARHALRQGPVPDGELRAAPYTLVDLHATARYHLAGRMHEITARADNTFDVAYRDAASRVKEFAPGPGRNFSVSYRLIF